MNQVHSTHETSGHFHEDERGYLHKCFHTCRTRWYIWLPVVFIFQVLMFPLEHQAAEFVWQLPVFSDVGNVFGWDEFTNHEEPHE